MKITVIIPFYNSEKSIFRCAKSLFEQTLEDDIEFIFIDDCSSDNSMTIVKDTLVKYPNRYNQVSIFRHSSNCGVSFTRKEGAELASGDFVAWCDSDDWVEPNMFERMMSVVEQGHVDIVICNMYIHEKREQVEIERRTHFIASSSPHCAIKQFWTDKHIPRALLNTMIRKNLILKGLNEIVPVNYSEDTYSILRCFYNANVVKWIDDCLYHYDMSCNPSSLTARKFATKQEWELQKSNIDSIQKMLTADDDNEEYRITINYIKWWWKEQFIDSFDDCWTYWKTYNECYKDICTISHSGGLNKIKIFFANRFFPIFWLRMHKKWK